MEKKAATVKKPAVKKVAAKAPAKKAAAKKPAAKKTVAKAAEVKTAICIQYQDREWDSKALVQTVKDIMKYDMQIDPKTAKEIQLYVNTEEDRVYFVVNGELSGSFAL
ncbi:MAG: hypothetical protein J5935_06365 [Lachnospiraceae bacterium]|nr:hypothetical protein [Lachnospiraceae bacterium]